MWKLELISNILWLIAACYLFLYLNWMGQHTYQTVPTDFVDGMQ